MLYTKKCRACGYEEETTIKPDISKLEECPICFRYKLELVGEIDNTLDMTGG